MTPTATHGRLRGRRFQRSCTCPCCCDCNVKLVGLTLRTSLEAVRFCGVVAKSKALDRFCVTIAGKTDTANGELVVFRTVVGVSEMGGVAVTTRRPGLIENRPVVPGSGVACAP